jgi:hypothetical protein
VISPHRRLVPRMPKHTHTYAILEVPEEVFKPIAKLLREAGYHGAFQREDGQTVIDMDGFALKSEVERPVGDAA